MSDAGELALLGVSSSQTDLLTVNEMSGTPMTDVTSFEAWTNDISSTRRPANAMPLVVNGWMLRV